MSTASFGDSASGAGCLDITYRLYQDDDSKLEQVTAPADTLAHDPSAPAWGLALAPGLPAAQRSAALAELFCLPTDEPLPAGAAEEGAPLQPRFSGVLLMTAASVRSSSVAPIGVPGDQPGAQRNIGGGEWGRYAPRDTGKPGTLERRIFLQENGRDISPWHDIPLRNSDGTINMVCEIPKDTTAKLEVATGEEGTPIKQDVKKGKPRFYHEPIPWNYGMLPQTWEDPQHCDAALGNLTGDNDPVDVVELSGVQLAAGSVHRVRALGAFAMIDEGELDWKVLCVRADLPLAERLHDIADIERELPGELERVMIWFRDYKIPDGKPPNAFGYGGAPLGASLAGRVISDTHALYQDLVSGARANDEALFLT
ncbi:hypothetical protein WJX81_002747 [Elliptochloris bilobata]|uniref:inorganic diphosphatase n=1 Tax=Elliptochloris bilobata TaxID=381761 RepID=A0AAW1RW21_9CHLO